MISGLSASPGPAEENFVCKGGIGPGAKATRVLFEALLKSEVGVPLLDFSEKEIRFAYYYKKGLPMNKINREVSIT